ncbi:unnamed protein product [Protopolystoma xenopodis]|uniref:Uncharacterized protein n=1 Tax=Protopolystoma xenopodis TaxID=117903 RepID=A0A448XLJ2_9PLAT|nr:unnamed protein product [Protopolystoma xenopodis]
MVTMTKPQRLLFLQPVPHRDPPFLPFFLFFCRPATVGYCRRTGGLTPHSTASTGQVSGLASTHLIMGARWEVYGKDMRTFDVQGVLA